jgi:H+/Cl- antiporter ClcA
MNSSTADESLKVMHSRQYMALLFIAALLGVPISAAAYWFLWASNHGRKWIFEELPLALGFSTAPAWWPMPVLAVGGLLTGAAIGFLPGRGGHSPADGFQAGRPPKGRELPGVLLAALASLCFGAVVGPEGPLIALGSGLAALVLWVCKRDATDTYMVGALLLLMVCKGLAYGISLNSFRGGPVFPAIFLGGTAGILLAHLPGLSATAGIAMGMGAMAAVMLRMPMTAVLLASLLLGAEGVVAMPLVIVAVVVAVVVTGWLETRFARHFDRLETNE